MSQDPGRNRSTTISDVAREAGVSPMTVSKVLRGTGRISTETRRRVERVAEDLGYVPNRLAGALSSRTSTLVGVLIPSIGDAVYSGVLAGINAVLNPLGYTGLIGETFFDPDKESRLVRMMLSMKPAGLILTGGLARTETTTRLIQRGGVRAVQLWDGDRPDLDATVGLSHRDAGRIAADAFLSADLEDCAYVGAELDRDLCAARRMQGYRDRLAEGGRSCRILTDPALPRTATSGHELTRRLLAEGRPPQAIHYLNDAMAIGGLRHLAEVGLAVPEVVSVIGFNGTALIHAVRTHLATIEVPLDLAGRRAAEAVVAIGGDRPAGAVEFIPIRFVPGNTVRRAP